MGSMVNDYSKHGNIDEYIYKYHPKKELFKEYRNKWANNKKNELLFLLLETNSICNFSCSMCIHSVGYEKTKPMSDEIFNQSVKFIQEMKIPSICLNQINEPLLDNKIIDRIKAVNSINTVVDTYINTNASLLNEKKSIELLNSGLTRLRIGFDGYSKETFEKAREGSNYEEVLSNILNFLALKKKLNKIFPIVRISFVRTSQNELELEEWYEFWKDKVDYISIQEYLTPVLDNSKNHLITKNSKRFDVEPLNITCHSPFERAIIRGDGNVLPCCSHFATNMVMGNILKQSLNEIWEGSIFADLRHNFSSNTWQKHPICSKCLSISYGIEVKDENSRV